MRAWIFRCALSKRWAVGVERRLMVLRRVLESRFTYRYERQCVCVCVHLSERQGGRKEQLHHRKWRHFDRWNTMQGKHEDIGFNSNNYGTPCLSPLHVTGFAEKHAISSEDGKSTSCQNCLRTQRNSRKWNQMENIKPNELDPGCGMPRQKFHQACEVCNGFARAVNKKVNACVARVRPFPRQWQKYYNCCRLLDNTPPNWRGLFSGGGGQPSSLLSR